MPKKKRKHLEFRYYEMPGDTYVLALLGESWVREYGRKSDPLHFHNYMEIGFCYGGEGEMILDDKAYPFFSDMFSVIPPNYPHNTWTKPGNVGHWEYLFVDVERFLKDMYPDKPRVVEDLLQKVYQKAYFLTYEGNVALGDAVQGMIQEMRYYKPYYKERIRGLLLSFLVETARLSSEQKEEGREDAHRQIDQVKIGNALHHVGKHYAEQIRIETLAQRCNLSETHFRRVFRSVMNMSPMEYVNLVRIQTACRMLENSDASLEEIAMKTGFISMTTFTRNFKKLTHTTPHQWRRQSEAYYKNLHRYHISVETGWK